MKTNRLNKMARSVPRSLLVLALVAGIAPLAVGGAAWTASFNPPVTVPVGNEPLSVSVGDLNADGMPDLAVANAADNNVSVLLGSGGASFAPRVNYGAGTYPDAVAVALLSQDAFPDLVIANQDSGDVSVLLGAGGGAFDAATHYSLGAGALPVALVAGDFNEDGSIDVGVADFGHNAVVVLAGSASGALGAPVSFVAGTEPMSIAAGDVNGDLNLDLVVANQATDTVSVLLGAGNGTFAAPASVAVGRNPTSAVLADLDGNGTLDLAVSNYVDDSVGVLAGAGNGSFAAMVVYPVGTYPGALIAADFNGDARPDLAVVNTGVAAPFTTSVLTNSGTGTFGAAVNLTVGDTPWSLVASAFGRLRPGLAVANFGSDDLSILLQDQPPAISKTYTPWVVQIGVPSTVSYVITNPNAALALSGVAFTDNLPANLTVADAAVGVSNTCGGTWAPALGASSVSLAGGAIVAGGSCTLSVTVSSMLAGTYTNATGPVTALETGDGVASAPATLIVAEHVLFMPLVAR